MRQRKSMFEVAALLDDTIEKGEKVERLASMSLADLVLEHRRVSKSLRSSSNPIRTEALLAAKGRLEHLIAKSRGGDLFKSISFNPLEPHAMDAESSYYSPYRLLADGSYAPHPTEHWMQQEPSLFLDGEFGGRRVGVGSAHSEAQRRDGYSEVDRFYRAAGVFKSELYAKVDDLVKAISLKPPGSKKGRKGLPVGTVHTWNGVQFRKEADGQWLPVPQGGNRPHPIEQDAVAKQGKIQKILEARKTGKAQEPSFEDRARVATAKHKDLSAKEAELESRDREAASRDHDHREKAVSEQETKLKEQQKAVEDHSKALEEHNKKAPLEHQFLGYEGQTALEKKIAKRAPGKGEHVELTKAELTHTLKRGKFSLISAGKNHNHPDDAQLDDKAIKARNNKLEQELKAAGYAYTRVKGHYGGEEDSFLVMVHQADKQHIVALGKKLNQESVIYAEGGKQEMIYTTGPKAGQSHEGKGFTEKADAEDYYTDMKTADGGKVKFSLNFDFDNLKGTAEKQKPKKLSDEEETALGKTMSHIGPEHMDKIFNTKGATTVNAKDIVYRPSPADAVARARGKAVHAIKSGGKPRDPLTVWKVNRADGSHFFSLRDGNTTFQLFRGEKWEKFPVNVEKEIDEKDLTPVAEHGRSDDKPHNHMGPPPPENADFLKKGAELEPEMVDRFIKQFEPDFVEMSGARDIFTKAGAVHFSARLKKAKSLFTKMKGRFKDRDLNSVGDVIGMRAVCKSIKDQRAMIDAAKQHFQVFAVEDTIDKGRDTGYRACHVALRSASGKMVELQLKTHNQHAWADYSHSRVYKPEETIAELPNLGLDDKTIADVTGKLNGLKNDPEVGKYMVALSDHLYKEDSGEKVGELPDPPQVIKDLAQHVPHMIFDPHHNYEEKVKKAMKATKFFVIEHNDQDRPHAIHEFDSMEEATACRKKLKAEHTAPIAHATSKEELLAAWPEYRPYPFGKKNKEAKK